MNPSELVQFIERHQETIIANPMNPAEKAPFPEAIPRCVDPETGENHLLDMLKKLSVADAEIVIADAAQQATQT